MIFAILLLVALVVLWSLLPGFTKPIRDEHGKKKVGSIASLEKMILGGVTQWILLRGEDITRPVILFLHGGPGTSNMGLMRKYADELEKHFVVVTWDQRGAGKSYSAMNPWSSMTIAQMVKDTQELTDLLCHRFERDKIILAGHSWGSVLGVLTVHASPGKYLAWIGIGQVVNMTEGERQSYEWTLEQARKASDAKAIQQLSALGVPPYSGAWQKKTMTQRRWLAKFGGEVHGSTSGAMPVVLSTLLSATEYTLPDKVNFFRGIFGSMKLLWPELLTVDLNQSANRLEIPVYLFLGRHDHEAPSELAAHWYRHLDAPHKELLWFERSAHLPNVEEKEKFQENLIRLSKETSQGRA